MFEAELEEISLLKDSMDVIAELIDEATLELKPEGLYLKAADRAVVTVVDFFMPKESFKSYSLGEPKKIGLNLSHFLQILKRSDPTDTMKFKLDKDRLEIKMSGTSTRSFKIPLIDVSTEEMPPTTELSFSSSFKINSEILNRGIEDADVITDSVVFNVTNNGISMKADSDASSAELELGMDSTSLRDLNAKENVKARYSLDYLKKIIKSRKLASEAEISMSTDYPMKLRFDVPGKLQLGFILAPRVEEG
jgi:proliferating cell nuclear antigen